MKFASMFLVGITFLTLSCKKSSPEVDPELDTPPIDIPENIGDIVKYQDVWYQRGDTIYGYKDYVYLVVGDADSPLLLGVPHDGIESGSPIIPETGTTGRDINTSLFSTAIAELFEQDTEKKPWIMVNTISRKRVDPNSYPDAAASRYQNPDAKATYDSYHELLTLARITLARNQENGPGGLFLDVHGHAHRYYNGHQEPYTYVVTGNTVLNNFICQTDVGYAINNDDLEKSDAHLDALASGSSIAYLADAHPDVPFSQLIRGPKSFGGLLAAEQVTAVPSTELPILDRNALLFGMEGVGVIEGRRPYFNGGYCTRKYGTGRTGSTLGFDDNIVSIQIETPGINVRNNPTIISRSSHQFKRAIIAYLNHWFGYDYTNSAYPY